MADSISTETGGTIFRIGGNDNGDATRDSGRSNTGTDSASGQQEKGTVFLTPDETPKRGRRTSKAAAATATDGAASMLVGVVETFGRMRYGQSGAMSATERTMIESGAKSSLASLPPEVAKRIADISGPVMCLMGLMMYASRMAALETYRRANMADNARSAAVSQAEQVVRQHTATAGATPTNGYVAPSAPPETPPATRQNFAGPTTPASKDDLFDLMQ